MTEDSEDSGYDRKLLKKLKKRSRSHVHTEHPDMHSSPYMLDDKAKEICQLLIIKGDVVFDDLGWTKLQRREFLSKIGVKKELTKLTRIWEDRNAIQDRAAFFASVNLQRMVGPAVNILAHRLRGPINPTNGQPYPDPTPTDEQYQAALEVLDRSGIKSKDYDETTPAPIIDARTVNFGSSPDLKDDSLDSTTKRERMRNSLQLMLHKLQKATGIQELTPLEKKTLEASE